MPSVPGFRHVLAALHVAWADAQGVGQDLRIGDIWIHVRRSDRNPEAVLGPPGPEAILHHPPEDLIVQHRCATIGVSGEDKGVQAVLRVRIRGIVSELLLQHGGKPVASVSGKCGKS